MQRTLNESQWFDTISLGLLALNADRSFRWWIGAALDCIANNHAHLITSRCGSVVYMLRCWLSHPKPAGPGVSSPYESGNATLLHWILQPDDIPHLHNHPWTFQTHILAGGYVEERNGRGLMHEYERRPTATVLAGLGDFHRIASHLQGPGDPHTGQGGTWSLVHTGPRVQPWSFLIDGCERDAETYLRNKLTPA